MLYLDDDSVAGVTDWVSLCSVADLGPLGRSSPALTNWPPVSEAETLTELQISSVAAGKLRCVNFDLSG